MSEFFDSYLDNQKYDDSYSRAIQESQSAGLMKDKAFEKKMETQAKLEQNVNDIKELMTSLGIPIAEESIKAYALRKGLSKLKDKVISLGGDYAIKTNSLLKDKLKSYVETATEQAKDLSESARTKIGNMAGKAQELLNSKVATAKDAVNEAMKGTQNVVQDKVSNVKAQADNAVSSARSQATDKLSDAKDTIKVQQGDMNRLVQNKMADANARVSNISDEARGRYSTMELPKANASSISMDERVAEIAKGRKLKQLARSYRKQFPQEVLPDSEPSEGWNSFFKNKGLRNVEITDKDLQKARTMHLGDYAPPNPLEGEGSVFEPQSFLNRVTETPSLQRSPFAMDEETANAMRNLRVFNSKAEMDSYRQAASDTSARMKGQLPDFETLGIKEAPRPQVLMDQLAPMREMNMKPSMIGATEELKESKRGLSDMANGFKNKFTDMFNRGNTSMRSAVNQAQTNAMSQAKQVQSSVEQAQQLASEKADNIATTSRSTMSEAMSGAMENLPTLKVNTDTLTKVADPMGTSRNMNMPTSQTFENPVFEGNTTEDVADNVAKTVAKGAAESGLEEAAEGAGAAAISEGGLDPVADVAAGIAGLATLIGGIFIHPKHHNPAPPPPPRPLNPAFALNV